MKFRNHSSITAIKSLNNESGFNSCRVSVEDVIKEIKKLSKRKVSKSRDLPVK